MVSVSMPRFRWCLNCSISFSSVRFDAVLSAPLDQKSSVDLVMFASKDLPGHFKGAVRDYLAYTGLVWVGKGDAKGPPAQRVPVFYASHTLQPDQILAFFMRKLDVFYWHRSYQK
jgi:hypothetical protein